MGAVVRERFELVRQVGEGTFGEVHQARDLRSGGSVALKVWSSRSPDLARFRREAAALAAIDHPGIVRYVDHGCDAGGRPYLAMEWLEGHTLRQRLERGVLSIVEAAALGQQVADALDAAAQALSAIHRDLKPDNLFLCDGDPGQTKVLDFGLVHVELDDELHSLTQTGALLGTPAYMSPELASGASVVDARSDVFSLGVVLYQCLTGRLPFQGAGLMATLMKICVENPEPVEVLRPDVPADFSALVYRMLDKTPNDRPDHAEVSRALLEVARTAASPGAASHPTLSLAPANDASPLPSLRVGGEQRVLCGLFVGPVEPGFEEPTAQLNQLWFEHGARVHRVRDGTRVWLLDGTLAASDQATAAARCAGALRRLLPDVAVAVCTGRAVVEHDTPVGELIDRGASLLERTARGVTRIDDDSASLLRPRFDVLGSPGAHALGEERLEEDPGWELAVGDCTFVGRTMELAQLDAQFEGCVADHTRSVVVVTAPAGAGKSRLRREWQRGLVRSGSDCEVLVGRGDSLCQAVRFGVLHSAVRGYAGISSDDSHDRQCEKLQAKLEQLLPPAAALETAEYLGEMLSLRFPDAGRPTLKAARRDPQLMADWVLNSWLTWVEALCKRRPLVLIVEDLHWADPASLRFLEAALRVGETTPLMVVAFARPEVHERDPLLWAHHDATNLRLRKLGRRDCETLLRERGGGALADDARERLLELADGNPFFLQELARTYHHDPTMPELPSSMLGILQIRLDALGKDAKLLLRAASIYGRSFQVDGVRALLLAHSTRLDVDAELLRLQQLGVLRRQPERGTQALCFQHALLWDAAYQLLTEEDRVLGHHLAARWLEATQATPPALLAAHYERAQQPEAAAKWYAQASLDAMAGGTMEEAVRLGKRSVECSSAGAEAGEAAALVAEALSWRGEGEEAQRWATRALQHLTQGSSGWWRAMQVKVSAQVSCGEPTAFAQAQEMLDAACTQGWTPQRVVTLSIIAFNAYQRGSAELGRAIAARLPTSGPSLTDVAAGYPSQVWAADSSARGDWATAADHARAAAAVFRGCGATDMLVAALNSLGLSLTNLGQFDAATAAFDEAMALSRRRGMALMVIALNVNLASIETQRGEPGTARHRLDETVRQAAHEYAAFLEAHVLRELARAALSLGQFELALAHATEAAQMAEFDPHFTCIALAIASLAEGSLGRLGKARSLAQRALTLVRDHALTAEVALVWIAALEATEAQGVTAETSALAKEARRHLDDSAGNIRDRALRASFEQNVPDNRRLRELVDQLAPDA